MVDSSPYNLYSQSTSKSFKASYYAYKFEAGGQTVVVSGDMSQNEQIVDFAKGADIFVVDALLAADFSDVPEAIRETLRQNLSKAHISNPQI